jgi:hypothetical protein
MCFAPYVSLSTFAVEFVLALYFLLTKPRDRLHQIVALISILLGVYQLNEFLICTTQHSLFTRLAMITTAILPAIGVSFALIAGRKRITRAWHLLLYAPAAFFIVMFSQIRAYGESALCHTVFIQYPGAGLLGEFYGAYYVIYIAGSATLFYLFSQQAKRKEERVLLNLGMLGMGIFTIPTFIFLIFLPALRTQLASVLCEFALLLAIELIVLLWYKEKHGLEY